MSSSVYRVMEIIGSSPNSWEEAAKTAVEKAGIHREDLRVAEVVEFDMKIDAKLPPRPSSAPSPPDPAGATQR
jgi:flavin-binding protein dodecin